jgi:hypothetical protein
VNRHWPRQAEKISSAIGRSLSNTEAHYVITAIGNTSPVFGYHFWRSHNASLPLQRYVSVEWLMSSMSLGAAVTLNAYTGLEEYLLPSYQLAVLVVCLVTYLNSYFLHKRNVTPTLHTYLIQIQTEQTWVGFRFLAFSFFPLIALGKTNPIDLHGLLRG